MYGNMLFWYRPQQKSLIIISIFFSTEKEIKKIPIEIVTLHNRIGFLPTFKVPKPKISRLLKPLSSCTHARTRDGIFSFQILKDYLFACVDEHQIMLKTKHFSRSIFEFKHIPKLT